MQGLGLFSATALVAGSMIGSGIFIVPADISRNVGSPALLIAAWLVTAAMTMIGALSYGELAAMMPKAGGQYVYLRESLGPMWGFLYGWTLFLVIQTGTLAAVAVAFGKFLGVFFPGVSASHWLWHIGHVPAWRVGPMVLGNMEIGLNTSNLAGVVVIVLLALVNIFGVKSGALVQNIFTTAKVASLVGLVALGFLVGRNPAAIHANFGANFWKGAGLGTLHAVQVGMGGPIAMVGVFAIVAVVQTGSLFSADAWNNVTFTAGEVQNPRRNLPLSLVLGTGMVLGLYILCNRGLSDGPADARRSSWSDGVCARHSIRLRRSRCYGGAATDFLDARRLPDGCGDFDFDLRLREWNDAGRGARLLCDEPRWTVLQGCGKVASALQDAGGIADCAGGVDLFFVPLGFVLAVARLHDVCGAGVLHSYDWGTFRAAREGARCATSL